ncbi:MULTISPECIES: Mpo1 family 2-hydroxy fatty acid dioxygenase [Tenacibaculum]|uniref:Mpo1 family 2-hydroxy fatty acid dioxygenase n=1 Tax=Tenacibaculum TaxID=104267 RepID=UPI001F0B44F7|nr:MULTISPECIES: Mpo1-like protein [Tenacibaculum]MCH3882720.1 DUF962 domain-containing protein [Tenacibaculum aquimarinum]MDO6600249.1 DUF962 domain-containing protein [Tenacibaculum sp. 1_MG-2023]
MRTAQQWFDEYAVSHQNETNQLIHYICVPAIFFSVIGLFMSIPTSFLTFLKLNNPLLENWAFVVGILISFGFYLRLGFWYFLQMVLVILLSIAGNYWISSSFNLLWFSIGVFVIAWIGQFYGHKVEGKKPSLFKDLQFLLIGPLWVIQKLGGKK